MQTFKSSAPKMHHRHVGALVPWRVSPSTHRRVDVFALAVMRSCTRALSACSLSTRALYTRVLYTRALADRALAACALAARELAARELARRTLLRRSQSRIGLFAWWLNSAFPRCRISALVR